MTIASISYQKGYHLVITTGATKKVANNTLVTDYTITSFKLEKRRMFMSRPYIGDVLSLMVYLSNNGHPNALRQVLYSETLTCLRYGRWDGTYERNLRDVMKSGSQWYDFVNKQFDKTNVLPRMSQANWDAINDRAKKVNMNDYLKIWAVLLDYTDKGRRTKLKLIHSI